MNNDAMRQMLFHINSGLFTQQKSTIDIFELLKFKSNTGADKKDKTTQYFNFP